MRLEEFRRIKVKVIKDEVTIYEGEAEEMPEELKGLNTIAIKIQPGLAEAVVEDEKVEETEEI